VLLPERKGRQRAGIKGEKDTPMNVIAQRIIDV